MFGRKIGKKIDELNKNLELANLREFAELLGNRKKVFWLNIWAGIGRGIGIGIGVTVITALIVFLLRKIVMLNIPIIGNYVSDLMEIVERGRY